MFFHYVAVHREAMVTSAFGNALLHFSNIGWIGVDIFFAISGFLVTTVILRSVRDWPDILVFWQRRVFRLFPAYFTVLLVIAAAISYSAQIGIVGTEKLFEYQIWAWGHLANIPGALIDRGALGGPHISAVHLWSLSLEEHVYLLWPILMVACRHKLNVVLPVLFVLPLFARAAALSLGLNDNAVYSLLPFRIDAFAFASWMALLIYECRVNASRLKILAVVGLVCGAGIVSYLLLDSGWHKRQPLIQVFGYSALAIFGGVTVALAYENRLPRILMAALSSSVIVSIGTYSYSLYLWHLVFAGFITAQLKIVLLDSVASSWPNFWYVLLDVIINGLFAMLLALISRELIEKPAFRFKTRYPPLEGSDRGRV